MIKRIWVMLGIIGYLTIVTIVSTSIELTLTSEVGLMISTDSAGLTVSFFESSLSMLLKVLTFAIPGIPAVWYFFLFYPAIFAFAFIIIDLVKYLFFSV